MTLPELEHFLTTTEIPNTVNLNKAVRVNDTAQFIETNLSRIQSYKGDINRHPSYIHLMDLVRVVNEELEKEKEV